MLLYDSTFTITKITTFNIAISVFYLSKKEPVGITVGGLYLIIGLYCERLNNKTIFKVDYIT